MTMFTTPLAPFQGSCLTPAYEDATVGDAMHPGVFEVPADAGIVEVARLMAGSHVHCAVVRRPDGWSLVTAMDVVRSADRDDGATAAEMARPAPAVKATEALGHAAGQMAATGAEHVLVLGPRERPVGVLSSLDVAGIVAWGRG
jgi:CBS domain-containing protein